MPLRTAPASAFDASLTAPTPNVLCTAAWIARWFRSAITGYLVTDGERVRFLTSDGPFFDVPLADAGAGAAPWYAMGTWVKIRVDGGSQYVSFAPPREYDRHDPGVLEAYAGMNGRLLALQAAAAPEPSITTARHAARRWQAVLDRGAIDGGNATAVQALIGAEAAQQTAETVRPAWRDWVPATFKIVVSVAFGLLLGLIGVGKVSEGQALGWAYVVVGPLTGILSAVAVTRRVKQRRRAARIIAALLALTVAPPAVTRPAAAQQGATCAAGAKREVVWRGTWYPATIKGGPNAQRQCLIGYDGFGTNWDEWVGADRMRQTPAADAAAKPHAARVAAGDYNCVSFVGSVTSGGHLVHVGELAITGPGTYRSRGANGSYAYDAGTGLVRFAGGPWDGQRANYDAAPRPAFHVLGPSGRAVEDCDGPAR